MRGNSKLRRQCIGLLVCAASVQAASAAEKPAPAVIVRPADQRIERVERNASSGELRVLGSPLATQIAIAHGFHPLDVIDREVELPRDALLDVFVRPPDGELQTAERLLREHLAARYGYQPTTVVRNTHAAVLRPLAGWPPLEPSNSPASVERRHGRFAGKGVPISSLISFVRSIAGQPVVDETGLTDRYDLVLEWDTTSEPLALVQAFADIGLEMVFERRDVSFLVLRKRP